MQNGIKVAFFWHMHQPDYRDKDGIMQLPWVFLHAIKDYYEMPWLLNDFKNLKATFNITPTLIEQLDLYCTDTKNDYFLNLLRQEPSKLDETQRDFVVKIIKSTQFETMVKPFFRFSQLYFQENYSYDELNELEVLFLLAWSGNYLRKTKIQIQNLIKKGRDFTQEDKMSLLDTLLDFIPTILPYYASLQKSGKILISTTPYFHPILPLLLDAKIAKISNPNTTLPENIISMSDDATKHIQKAIKIYERHFELSPSGFWPAEGGVDEKSIELYKKFNLKWIATDEAILFKSLGTYDRANLYKEYSFNGINIGFRDISLSDLIGFSYRHKDAFEASSHFVSSLENIKNSYNNARVNIILDGENAWEFYKNNAFEFFTSLYAKLDSLEWHKSILMDSDDSNTVKLNKLHPGSWIHSNFDTWIGHSEKNRAWELIYQTKSDLLNYGKIEDTVTSQIEYHFLAAQSSDWFWWYGDDHSTEFSLEFDKLFRSHLIDIYNLANLVVPQNLYTPIITALKDEKCFLTPTKLLDIHIDAKCKNIFKWLGSGVVDETKLYSTMDHKRGPLEQLYYGFNNSSIFLMIKGDIETLKQKNISIIIKDVHSKKVIEFTKDIIYKDDKLMIDECLELSISRKHFKNQDIVSLMIELVNDLEILQISPSFGALTIDFREKFNSNWFV